MNLSLDSHLDFKVDVCSSHFPRALRRCYPPHAGRDSQPPSNFPSCLFRPPLFPLSPPFYSSFRFSKLRNTSRFSDNWISCIPYRSTFPLKVPYWNPTYSAYEIARTFSTVLSI
ncbi:hypothetical protein BJV78DRAFT_736164 [Lactifluus subvellereus]|nr:hypothetical protein BJV78DRAFT_736164 [Lactifluus subvellereus]